MTDFSRWRALCDAVTGAEPNDTTINQIRLTQALRDILVGASCIFAGFVGFCLTVFLLTFLTLVLA